MRPCQDPVAGRTLADPDLDLPPGSFRFSPRGSPDRPDEKDCAVFLSGYATQGTTSRGKSGCRDLTKHSRTWTAIVPPAYIPHSPSRSCPALTETTCRTPRT